MTFSVGDRVKFLDFGESGTVVAVLDDASLVIDVDGIDMRVSVKEIVRVGKESCADEVRLYDGNSQVSRFKAVPDKRVNAVRSGKKAHRAASAMVVDLHIGSIRQSCPAARNIPDSDVLFVQLDVFEKSMAEAFRKGVSSVVFIHGNGRGVLRSRIIERLKEYPGVTYCTASPVRYGSGALDVFLK